MGKKSRIKAERRAGAPRSVKQAIRAADYHQKTEILTELHGALTRQHLLSMNDKPFSAPENLDKIEKTFGPMEHWLAEQERTGEADVMRDGTVVFFPDWDDGYYPVGDSFITVADTFELVAADLKIADQGDPLRKLGRRIKADMPIDQQAVTAAKESLAWMRSVTLSLTPTVLHKYTEAISTREEFKRLGIIPK